MTDQHQLPTRNIALELVRVTEAAALAAGPYVGRGQKNEADGAAVDAMRIVLNSTDISGVIVIGEGEKDEAPRLFNGEKVGSGGFELDIAVDPIDGTTLTADGLENAIAVIAAASKGAMFNPGPCVYMNKIAVGSKAKGTVDIDASVGENLNNIAKAKGIDVKELTVVILKRDRHLELIEQVRQAGSRIKLIRDGDVAGAISTAIDDSGVDVLMGIGGTPEGVISAAALKCMGGEIVGRLAPRDSTERKKAIELGYDLDEVLTTDRLVGGDEIFFSATGITSGELLPGVIYTANGAQTWSFSMRSRSGTVRKIESNHQLDKLREYAVINY